MNEAAPSGRRWWVQMAFACSIGLGVGLALRGGGKGNKPAVRERPQPRKATKALAQRAAPPSPLALQQDPNEPNVRDPNNPIKRAQPRRQNPPKRAPAAPTHETGFALDGIKYVPRTPIIARIQDTKAKGETPKMLVPVTAQSKWPVGRHILKYTEPSLPQSLNPLFAATPVSLRLQSLLFESLVSLDSKGKPVAQLALRWEQSPGQRSITVHLRRSVRWHDGRLFTAEDVALSLKHYAMQRTRLPHRVMGAILHRVVVLRHDQVRLEFRQWRKDIMRRLSAIKILPAHLKKLWTKPQGYFGQKPVGTGPFRLGRRMGRKLHLLRNTLYWRPCAQSLRAVKLQVIPDRELAVEVLRYGGVDLAWQLPWGKPSALERAPNIRLYPYTSESWWMLAFRQSRGALLRDRRLREAIALALDRDELRKQFLGDGQTISGPMTPNHPGYNFQVSSRRVDLAAAASRLEDAGWHLQQGVRRKNNVRLQLRMGITSQQRGSIIKGLIASIHKRLAQLGISVQLIRLGQTTVTAAMFQEKRLDLALMTLPHSRSSLLNVLFASTYSPFGYRRSLSDLSLKLLRLAASPERYQRHAKRLHQQLNRDVAGLFLWSLTSYAAASSRLKNILLDPRDAFGRFCRWEKQ